MYKGKSFLAIVPARAGSKRIPNKNTKLLKGKSLVEWTIEEAKKSKLIDRICVSTEDEKISSIARRTGADVPVLRPKELAQDESKTVNCVLHLLNWIEDHEHTRYDYIVLLQPTSPFRKAAQIDEVLKKIVNLKTINSVISFRKANVNPLWLANKDEEGRARDFFSIDAGENTIINPGQAWECNGAIYVCSSENIKKHKSLKIDDIFLYEMDKRSSVDIDTEDDWVYAEFLLEKGLIK